MELGDFPLDLDDPLGGREAGLEAGHAAAQALVLDAQRVAGWPAPGVGEVVEGAETVQPAVAPPPPAAWPYSAQSWGW